MTVSQTIVYEMFLLAPLVDGSGNTLVDGDGNILIGPAWVDVTADVLAPSNPTWNRGNSGRTIFDRVANIGSFNYQLNNSEYNENETLGYYSPDHANVASEFGLDTKVRITIMEGANTHKEWQGEISSIKPAFGRYKSRRTSITCEDWMAHAYRDKIRGVTVQTGKRDDELLATLIALASTPPSGGTDFSTGDDTYTYAFHDENSITSTLARVFQKIMMSGFGRLFLTDYETLTYLSRSDLLLSGSPAAVLSDSMTDVQVSRSKAQRIKDILVTTYPSQVDSSAVVLWQSQKEEQILAGETITFDVSLRDPSGRATRVAALSLETPVADTDFKFSSTSGSGNDLNGSLTISYVLKADIVSVSLTNTSGSTGYLWIHQIQGIGVYLYEPVTKEALTGQRDGETLTIDMVYQDDSSVGADILTLLTYWFLFDQSDVESVTFLANKNQHLMDAAFLKEGDLVTIEETLTGVSNNFIINGISKTHAPGNKLWVTWYLIYANQISGVCRVDVPGLAELDSTAYLGA